MQTRVCAASFSKTSNWYVLIAPQPASFVDRLIMMTLFAHDLLNHIPSSNALYTPPIDIGIIKHARFLEKASTLRSAYPNIGEMTFLAGFDTLIRLFDSKYYGGTLEPLAPFFNERNRVRCSFRPMEEEGYEEWRKEQERYLEEIKEGKREGEGCLREWGSKVELTVNCPWCVQADMGSSTSADCEFE